jgi:hypothetical protein
MCTAKHAEFERKQLLALRRTVATELLNGPALAKLARCPNEAAVQGVLRVAIAELRAMRNPAFRRLAAGEGGEA